MCQSGESHEDDAGTQGGGGIQGEGGGEGEIERKGIGEKGK